MNGIINIYKERGYTSHDVVARLRGITGIRRAGHTGTLDPDAEGVLPVCIGTATKVCDILTDTSKSYEALMILGIATDSQDLTGNVIHRALPEELESLSDSRILETIAGFTGEYDQLPPMFSAVRKDGQRLYALARSGQEIERETRNVCIEKIEAVSDVIRGRFETDVDYDRFYDSSALKQYRSFGVMREQGRFARYASKSFEAGRTVDDPDADELKKDDTQVIRVAFKVTCSKGTYIRTLCHDIGEKLGVGGCMERLLRTRAGVFDVNTAITLEQAEEYMREGKLEEHLTGVDSLFDELPRLDVKEKYDELLQNGNQLYFRHFKQYITTPPQKVRTYTSKGEFLGIYGYVEGRNKYSPEKVFIEK
ncbi:MAG: tRNA pseudouridine(55) synthase TruB [Lachnospiraceae bacterium]|nr:tRNA pseudouridine(55) synthase TruB [Lachnospiraceae bacterium]